MRFMVPCLLLFHAIYYVIAYCYASLIFAMAHASHYMTIRFHYFTYVAIYITRHAVIPTPLRDAKVPITIQSV
jgi:hypothetical protein